MDLNRIATFVRVAELGSFTAAARETGAPKSSVSRAVSALEADLGVRLLQRTTRKLQLTEAGRAYLERARTGLAALEEANAEAGEMGDEPRGTVRMTAPIGSEILPGILTASPSDAIGSARISESSPSRCSRASLSWTSTQVAGSAPGIPAGRAAAVFLASGGSTANRATKAWGVTPPSLM